MILFCNILRKNTLHQTAILCLFLLSGCATPPQNISNACDMLREKKFFFSSWETSLVKAEKKYRIPAYIILATIHVESSFQPYAKPRRKKLLGFIPWKRLSTAYGYTQALDGTWAHYQKATNQPNASRTNFEDSVNFVAWFHNNSVKYNHISRFDTYNLYLNYYYGHGGYSKTQGKFSPAIKKAAQRAKDIATAYKKQLNSCYPQLFLF